MRIREERHSCQVKDLFCKVQKSSRIVTSTKEQIGIRLKCRTKRKIYTIRQQLIYILMHSMKNYLYVNCKSSLFYSRWEWLNWLIYLLCLTPLSVIFQLYHGYHFWWRRKPEYPERTTDHGKKLENFIICCCEWSAPFFVIYKAECELTPYWW